MLANSGPPAGHSSSGPSDWPNARGLDVDGPDDLVRLSFGNMRALFIILIGVTQISYSSISPDQAIVPDWF